MKSCAAFSRVLPFALYIGFLAIGSAFQYLQQAGTLHLGDMRWIYPVKILLVSISIILLWRNYDELSKSISNIADWAVGIAAGILVFILWINLDQSWGTIGQAQGYDPQGDVFLMVCRILGAALIVPVMEELFWRSFVMRWIDGANFIKVNPASISKKSILITAIMFASEHNFWLAGLLAGFVYGWLYMRTRNLWVPILAHGLTNGLLGLWVIQTKSWQFW
jgi:CAAX prenyl protease-like protein